MAALGGRGCCYPYETKREPTKDLVQARTGFGYASLLLDDNGSTPTEQHLGTSKLTVTS